ncbi:unnamed protein product [Cladocopium goreaui]|uniref:Membrane protein mmpL11 n=1 Tax=Cladocopium goreaui TaxID=2562237 RepID=A0A9P1G895_9DINO|nr:unnamed protein product [Cladocopium goreaui]
MQEKPQGSRLALVPPNDKDAKKAEKKAAQKAEKKARKAAKAAAKEDAERVLKAKEQKNQEKGKDAKDPLSKLEKTTTMASLDLLSSPCTPLKARSLSFSQADDEPSTGKKARVKELTEEQKQELASMSKPSDMDPSERKRQYSALRRAIIKDANPALVAKFSLASDAERFNMLKAWMANPNTGDLEIEERYVRWVQELRTDRFVTVTLFQLEKMFGKGKDAKEFISELCQGHLVDERLVCHSSITGLFLIADRVKNLQKDVPLCIAEIKNLGVRNCSELVRSLETYEKPLVNMLDKIEEELKVAASDVDAVKLVDFINAEKTGCQDVVNDLKDAKRRVSAEKRSQGLNKPRKAAVAEAAPVESDSEGRSVTNRSLEPVWPVLFDQQLPLGKYCGSGGVIQHFAEEIAGEVSPEKPSQPCRCKCWLAGELPSSILAVAAPAAMAEDASKPCRALYGLQFFAWRQSVLGVHTWVQLPGWGIQVLCHDWLHVVDLTLVPEASASALLELCHEGIFGLGNLDEKLRRAHILFVKACRAEKVRSSGDGKVATWYLRFCGRALRAAVFVNLTAMREYMSGPANSIALTPENLAGLALEAINAGKLLWKVIPLVTGIAIALGLDYDIFLVSRIVEFRVQRYSDRASIFRGVLKTGDVISGAGLIMSLAFSGLIFSDKIFFQQFGVLIITSVLLDTFVVRTVLVPALMLIAQHWNWWPRSMPPPIHDVLEGEVESCGGLSRPILAQTSLDRMWQGAH